MEQKNRRNLKVIYINPKATAGCVITEKDKILLVKRANNPFLGYWGIPGGHIELFERAEVAVKREIKEELNIEIILKFFCIQEEIFKEIGWHAIVFFFTSKAKGNIKIKKDEITEVKFFPYSEINNLQIAFKHKEIISKYFKDAKH